MATAVPEGKQSNVSDPAVIRNSAAGGHLITVSGVIDERFDKHSLADGLSGVVVVSMDQVHRITSYGVREWIRAVKGMAAEYCCFVKCRPAVVSQFNIVANFAGPGALLTFYAPYHCPKCGEGFELLLDMREHYAHIKRLEAPEATCPTCKGPAEFDDIASDYFAYAAGHPVSGVPALVDALIDGTASKEAPFKVKKNVAGNVTALTLSGPMNQAARFKRVADGLEGKVLVLTQAVTSVSREALEALKAVLNDPGPSFYIARLPLDMALAMAKEPALLGRAQPISVMLTFGCTKCGERFQSEVGPRLLAKLRPGESGPPCPRCGAMTKAAADDVQDIAALPMVPAPEEIVVYLDLLDHPKLGDAVTGRQAFGRYELLRRLGAGGMAEVFLARQTSLGGFEKDIVLKRILPNLTGNSNFVTMLLDEARVAARISHPNVVQTFDVGQADGQYYIAMEYVSGWDLSVLLRLLQRFNMPFPVGLACRIMADICAGLHAAHCCTDDEGKSLAIIHRDVSPHNVLISRTGQVKMSDFGIAKASDARGSRTPTAMVKGKIAYLAPEQVNPQLGPTDSRADIFPCGLILMQCLTLKHIFRRETDLETLKAVLYDPIPLIDRPDVPQRLQEIAEKALARDLSQRYADAGMMREDLEQVIIAMGQPATAGELASWLSELMRRAQAEGLIAESSAPTSVPRLNLLPEDGAPAAPRREENTPTKSNTAKPES